MFESIGVSLIGSMISFLLKQNFLEKNDTDIQGAPIWYGKKENPKRIYVSTFVNSHTNDTNSAKNKAISKMVLIIENGYKVTIEKYFLGQYSKKEQTFIKKLRKKDLNLPKFIKQNMIFQNIKYNKKFKKIFIRGYLSTKLLKRYQISRIIETKKKMLEYQIDDMMEELKNKTSQKTIKRSQQ